MAACSMHIPTRRGSGSGSGTARHRYESDMPRRAATRRALAMEQCGQPSGRRRLAAKLRAARTQTQCYAALRSATHAPLTRGPRDGMVRGVARWHGVLRGRQVHSSQGLRRPQGEIRRLLCVAVVSSVRPNPFDRSSTQTVHCNPIRTRRE